MEDAIQSANDGNERDCQLGLVDYYGACYYPLRVPNELENQSSYWQLKQFRSRHALVLGNDTAVLKLFFTIRSKPTSPWTVQSCSVFQYQRPLRHCWAAITSFTLATQENILASSHTSQVPKTVVSEQWWTDMVSATEEYTSWPLTKFGVQWNTPIMRTPFGTREVS